MIKKNLKLALIINFFSTPSYSKSLYFEEGVEFFNKQKFDMAKLKFEQDIVFNPKNEMSYLYLSKIFKNLDKIKLQEQNLNTVVLINPKNEEAIFNLAKLKLASSDYTKSKELNDRLSLLCKNFCNNSKKLKRKNSNY